MFLIPKNSTKGAGLKTVLAANAKFSAKFDTAPLPEYKCLSWTDPGARGIITGPADYHLEALPDPSGRLNMDARPFQATLPKPPHTGEHACLTAYTTVDINHR